MSQKLVCSLIVPKGAIYIYDGEINMHIGNTLLIILLNMNRSSGSRRRRKPLGNENMFR